MGYHRNIVVLMLPFREIFGPILPIIAVEDVDEAINIINEGYAELWLHDRPTTDHQCIVTGH